MATPRVSAPHGDRRLGAVPLEKGWNTNRSNPEAVQDLNKVAQELGKSSVKTGFSSKNRGGQPFSEFPLAKFSSTHVSGLALDEIWNNIEY